jgi:hypothetical protein
MLMMSMLLLSSLHAVAGFITFASIPAVVGVPTLLAVLLLLSFLLLWAVMLKHAKHLLKMSAMRSMRRQFFSAFLASVGKF